MQIIISPAKLLDFKSELTCDKESAIRFPKEALRIITQLREYHPAELMTMMKINDKLAVLNYERFQKWNFPFKKEDVRQALFAFNGIVYKGLDAASLSNEDIDNTQSSLRILSGLYGLLKPLDNIMPYRLEMGTKLKINTHDNLYKLWGDKITELLNKDIKEGGHKSLINLASDEYFKVLNSNNINVPIITPVFKELKNGNYKVIVVHTKKARGLMCRFIIKNKLTDYEHLRAFDVDGYYYNNDMSTPLKPVFTRDRE